MQVYSSFRPTGFDSSGLAGERIGIAEWLVVSCSRTRDSGLLAETNFAAALRMLGGEGEDVEVHRFGHWGPGWFELILVRPGSAAERIGDEIEGILADYPSLDDEALSAAEHEDERRAWDQWGRRDFVRELVGAGLENAGDWPYQGVDTLDILLRAEPGYRDPERYSEGVSFFTDRNAALVSRELAARALREWRRERDSRRGETS